jgi:hypothetical protein
METILIIEATSPLESIEDIKAYEYELRRSLGSNALILGSQEASQIQAQNMTCNVRGDKPPYFAQ